MLNLLKNFWKEEEGQDLVEYAFLIAGIAMLVTGGITLIEDALNVQYGNIATAVETPF